MIGPNTFKSPEHFYQCVRNADHALVKEIREYVFSLCTPEERIAYMVEFNAIDSQIRKQYGDAPVPVSASSKLKLDLARKQSGGLLLFGLFVKAIQ